MLLVGQTFLAIGQPFIFNLPTKVSAIWFPKRERTTATMVAVNSAILGFVVGHYLSQVVVYKSINKADVANQRLLENAIRYEVLVLTLMMAVVELILLIMALFFFKENDLGRLKSNSTVDVYSDLDKMSDYDPQKHSLSNIRTTSQFGSRDIEVKVRGLQEEARNKFRAQFTLLVSNFNFLKLLVASSLFLATTLSLPRLLYQILLPYRFLPRELILQQTLYFAIGIAGGIISIIALITKKNYKVQTIVQALGAIITSVLYALLLAFDQSHQRIVMMLALHGGFSVSMYSVIFEYAAEITPGVGESYSAGLINVFANLIGLAQLFLFEGMLQGVAHPLFLAMFVLFIPVCISFLIFIFVSARQSNKPQA